MFYVFVYQKQHFSFEMILKQVFPINEINFVIRFDNISLNYRFPGGTLQPIRVVYRAYLQKINLHNCKQLLI